MKFLLNGASVDYEGAPMARLLDVLRADYSLTGTKEGCGEGECGACSVMVDDQVVCACLVPMLQVAEREVRTVEGLATPQGLDPLQQAFIDQAGVQCGACTPGMVVAGRALLDKVACPSREQMREHLAGNLCRCTGYQAIFRALEQVTEKAP